jgi:hypothetical protein
MNQNRSSPVRAASKGAVSHGAAMIMFGVIATMTAALPVDPNKVSVAAMARGAVTVGALVTIGSIAIEMLRNLLEDGVLPHSSAIEKIAIFHSFILTYPFVAAVVLLGGSFVGISSIQLFWALFFGGGAAAFLSGVTSRYMLDRRKGPAVLRGCLWLGLGLILILAKMFV